MKWTTSCASVAPNVPSGNGSCPAAACLMSAPGRRSRAAAANDADGSTALTDPAPTRLTSSAVSAEQRCSSVPARRP